MSYDLEVRSKPPFGEGVPLDQAASELLAFPDVSRTGPTSFGLDHPRAGLNLTIELSHQTGKEDEEERADAPPLRVNLAYFLVPYPVLDKTGPIALEMAFQLAERFDWSVYDPQTECELSRESLPSALRAQRSFRETAGKVLERAAEKDLSFGELFLQEMWSHRLLPAAGCFVLATVIGGWLMLEFDRPMADFDKYMPWIVALGGVALMWIKALAQATRRYRQLRRRPEETTSVG